MQKNLSTFLVSSAIHTRFGVFDAVQRLNQTVETIKSIRAKVPDACIVLVECSGASSITADELAILSEYVNTIFDYSRDQVVKQVHDTTNSADIVKNFTEIWVFAQALKRLITESDSNIITNASRIFKISGRYVLNAEFDISKYANNSNIIISNRRPSQFDSRLTGGVTQQFMSRLWSWPANKTNDIAKLYDTMLKDFISANSEQRYIDIEHLLFKHLEHCANLQETESVGVQGNLGPNGVLVKD